MKDFITLWNSLLGRTYDAVNTNTSVPPDRQNCQQNQTKGKSALTAAVLGVAGLVFGLLILLFNPYDILYRWKLVFGEGGEIFELWRKPPVELYLKVYLWNVTNRDEYMSGEEDILQIEEVGPYVYRELLSHENVTFNDNGTLSAIPKNPLIWVPEMSEGRREDDMLILPNIALLSIADVVSDESYFTRLGLNIVIRQTRSEPLVRMTAREFMFGYSNALMTLGNNFMPTWIYFDKLGLIDRMYDFDGDFETVFTGEKHDLSKIGLIDTYMGSTKIPQWDSPCGDVHGSSDGTKFPGFLKENDTLTFFRKSMCRAKALVKVNETVRNGFTGWVYHFDPNSDDNGYVNEKNKCFCKGPRKCLPPGLLDVRGCYYGFPIALSYPHFLDGDKALTAKVNGSNPDPEKHRSYFIIQPDSGLPLDLAVRYQINMALGSIKTIANCDRFNDMVLPLLWTEIRLYQLPPSLALKFRIYLSVLPIGQTVIMYALFIVGGVLVLYSIRKFVRARSNRTTFSTPWIQDNFVYNIDRKLSSYIPDRRTSASAREHEESLVTPLAQNIHEEV